MIKTRYSDDVDALLIQFSEKDVDVAEERGPYILHYAADGDLVLLEVLNGREFILEAVASVFAGKEHAAETPG
ncbi:MAG: DUF2283 domain-containing protein [bacterium]